MLLLYLSYWSLNVQIRRIRRMFGDQQRLYTHCNTLFTYNPGLIRASWGAFNPPRCADAQYQGKENPIFTLKLGNMETAELSQSQSGGDTRTSHGCTAGQSSIVISWTQVCMELEQVPPCCLHLWLWSDRVLASLETRCAGSKLLLGSPGQQTGSQLSKTTLL